MKTEEAENAFRSYLASKGLQVETLDATSAVDAMLGFYAERRVSDVVEDDGDMLLFQWGVYTSPRSGDRRFTYDITRQFIKEDAGDDDDDAIWQLSLTLSYPATEAAAAIPDGNQWCQSPQELETFRRTIADHPSTSVAKASAPVKRELIFQNAG